MTKRRDFDPTFKMFGKLTDSFRDLVLFSQFYGLKTHFDVACYLGVSLRTIQRWHDRDCAPDYAWKLLLFRTGHLGMVFPEWKDWKIKEDYIYDSNGFCADQTTIFMCQYEGNLVLQERTLRRQEELKLKYLTECLAGLMLLNDRKVSRPKTLKLFTEDGEPLTFSMQ